MTSDDASGPGDGKRARLPFDIGVAHQARMYDYVLGGKDNYAADREAVEAGLKAWPDMAFSMRANRAFLGRAVRYLAGQAGIRQFLDIGTGIPTSGNTHEVAQAIAPETRVVYVDYDPIVLAHARALLNSNETGATEYIDADLRDPGKILAQAARLLDFSQPVAVTLLSILHAIPDADDPWAIVATVMDAVPTGSYLAISPSAGTSSARTRCSGCRTPGKARSSSSSPSATGSRWRGSSQARTWWNPAWCRSMNGALSLARQARAIPPCGPP